MIFRSNKVKWTTVDNAWVKDPTLSARAKGLLLYILSLPDDWDLRMKELVTHFTDGIDGIRSSMKELSMHRYIDSNQRRDETGKIIGWDYTIFENPDEPQPEKPDMAKPYMAKPTLLNTNSILSTNKTYVPSNEVKEVIAHLNKVTGRTGKKKFQNTNKQAGGLINARLVQFSVSDLKAVIDIKARKWLDTEWEIYLRPTTLFNPNKFGIYINEIDVEGTESRKSGVMPLQDLR